MINIVIFKLNRALHFIQNVYEHSIVHIYQYNFSSLNYLHLVEVYQLKVFKKLN